MRWADLSTRAKGILEMTEGPYSGIRYSITVEVGQPPLFDGRRHKGLGDPIDRNLFDEMASYLRLTSDDYETMVIADDRFEIRLAAAQALHGP